MSNNLYNWADAGCELSTEDKSKRYGPNATDKKVVGSAFILRVRELDKFRATFGDNAVLKYVNGTSLDVTCEAWGRNHPNATREAFESWILANLRNQRTFGGTKTVTVTVKEFVIPTPTGVKKWSGTDEAELVAFLVDAGMTAAEAMAMAEAMF